MYFGDTAHSWRELPARSNAGSVAAFAGQAEPVATPAVPINPFYKKPIARANMRLENAAAPLK